MEIQVYPEGSIEIEFQIIALWCQHCDYEIGKVLVKVDKGFIYSGDEERGVHTAIIGCPGCKEKQDAKQT